MKSREWFVFLLVMSALVLGQGIHWLITPRPDVSDLRVWAVAAQVVVALSVTVYSFLQLRRISRATH